MTVFAFSFGLFILFSSHFGLLAPKDTNLYIISTIFRWGSSFTIGAIILLYAGWRWVPIIQSAIFPYLGGKWKGTVNYKDASGNDASKPVEMEVKHTLFGIKFLLESDESSSQTVSVYAEKNLDFDKFRIYYIYNNHRKEGLKGSEKTYLGLVSSRLELNGGNYSTLNGDYFTDTHRKGQIHLKFTEKNPFWKLWR